jgi:hypothetical protein
MNCEYSNFTVWNVGKTAFFRRKNRQRLIFSRDEATIIMQNVVEEIMQGIGEIRNLLGPINLKLQNLDHKVTDNRISFELRTSEFEARIKANTSKIFEQETKSEVHSRQIAILFERLQWMESCLNVPKRPDKEPGNSG